MSFFDSENSRRQSVQAEVAEIDFVRAIYDRLSTFYDLVFGPTLQPGRRDAILRMRIPPNARVLEVGVGTGINLPLYPRHAEITGIDFSSSMLEKARKRLWKKKLTHVRLLQMDAADMQLPDNSFDIVYAPYLISAVPDPVRVAREMRRVCEHGGRIVFLNHFLSPNILLSKIERLISPLTAHIGFRSDLALNGFLAQADLKPVSIEKVNFPKIWSLVTCIKE